MLGLMLVFSSCEKTVDYNIDDDIVKPVVYAFLSDSKAMVHLFWSSSYVSDNDEQEISNASIMLYEGENSLGTLSHISDGIYELTGICPMANVEYTITIDVPDYEGSIVAKTTMPAKVHADLFVTKEYHYEEGWPEEWGYYTDNLNLVFDDPLGVSNYYSYNVDKIQYVEGFEYWDEEDIVRHTSSVSINNVNQLMYTELEHIILFNDKYIDGTRYEYVVNNLSVSYIYDTEIHEDKDVDSAFMVPHFKTVNYDYYKFYCDAVGQSQASFNTSEAYCVYSNVENGFGIFAAYCEVTDTVVVHRNAVME